MAYLKSFTLMSAERDLHGNGSSGELVFHLEKTFLSLGDLVDYVGGPYMQKPLHVITQEEYGKGGYNPYEEDNIPHYLAVVDVFKNYAYIGDKTVWLL